MIISHKIEIAKNMCEVITTPGYYTFFKFMNTATDRHQFSTVDHFSCHFPHVKNKSAVKYQLGKKGTWMDIGEDLHGTQTSQNCLNPK